MEIVVMPDRDAVASVVADAVCALVARRPDAVLGVATGSSPEPVYRALAERRRAGASDFARVSVFQLDEYVGLSADDPNSYRSVVARQVAEPLGVAAAHGPDGSAADPEGACERYERQITAAGGIDLQLLGIGVNGHLGFNEPTSSFGSRTRIKSLTDQTRRDNARFFGDDVDAVPRHVLTQGLGTIAQARHLVLLATGAAKADAVARCVEGPVTAMVPASMLQLHPHVTVVVDEAAASGLSLLDYYRDTWACKPPWQQL